MSATQTKNFALVTGASQGLGREMAKELARQKRNVLLVALPGEGLPEFCKELKNGFGIEAYYFETDLTQSNSVFELAN
jgi:short-subunit dehydrogenase